MEPPRSPDFAFQDQLLNGDFEQDEELHKIILQSRQEYMEHENKRRQREQEKIHLKKKLAIPISRLSLWKRTTLVEQEKHCLHHIMNILYIKTHPDRDDDDIHVPWEDREQVLEFLKQYIRPSKLFREVYDVCMEYVLMTSE
jgi:hypothetical protein